MQKPTLHVACLCAGWCHLCDDYRAVLRSVAAEMEGAAASLRWHWIDIEDEADLVGDVDVETFPTVVISDVAGVRFAGPLMPHPDALRRLLRATVLEACEQTAWPVASSEMQAFTVRLRSRPSGAF